MIQINLLPVRRRKRKENVKQLIYLYFLALILALSGMGYLWIDQKNEIGSLDKRLAKLQQEVAQYAKYEAMLTELKTKKETIDKKNVIIRNVQGDRDSVVRMMALVSVEVPVEKMWFEKLALTSSGITMSGVALSNEAIAEFMLNLGSSPYVEKGSVNLTHSRQVLMTDMKLREFEINFRFFPFSKIQEQPKPKPS